MLAGAVLRLEHLNWDEGHHLHPDERFISMVEENLAFPKSPAAYLDSKHSTLNPYNRGYNSFVYGTLPMLVTKVFAAALRHEGYDGAYLVGRALSAIFDLLSVWLVYLLARRFVDRRAALAAAALIAFCPLGIQLSHFWAVDTYLAAFTTAALLGSVRLARGKSGPIGDAATGIAVGLAVGCKVTALALFAPVGIALLVRLAAERRAASAGFGRVLARVAGRGVLFFVACAVTIRLALPYAFLGWRLDPRYLNDMRSLALLSSSVAGFPPALQWAGRTILFPLRNFVLWGAAPFFGLTALAAVVFAALAVRRRERWALAPLLVYVLFIGLYHGTALVKSVRYFYPAYPALAALCGLLLAWLWSRPPRQRVLRALPAVVLAGSFLAAIAFTSIYRRPHTRLEASRWIFAHVATPARFGNEAWDDGLPIPMPGSEVAGYAGPVLNLFDPDSLAKVDKLIETLQGADWVAVTSNRVYANVTRIPLVYPMTTAYYRALFDGALGFERAAEFTSYPSLGPLVFDDDRAEEQFTVYDHPRVLLLRKTKDFSALRARHILVAALSGPPPTIWDWEKWPRARRKVSAPVIPSHRAAVPPARETDREIGSLPAAVLWYLALLGIGAAAMPLGWVVFSRLADRGFGFSRLLGLAAATYALNLGVARGGLANGPRTAVWAAAALLAAGAATFGARRGAILTFVRENRRALWQSEAAFLVGFLVFLALRAFNPEITWGEKPMDFSILNILVRSTTLPASDPWFSGAPLGYYTFGQGMIAFLTLLTGLSTRYTFNLAFGLLGGALVQGAFSLARNWAGTLRGGIAGAAFVALAGNLSGLREWLFVRRPQHQPLDWNYFWATSRVVKDTINEYPLWSLLFADLHAHVLAMPLVLLFLAQALQLVRVHADPASTARGRLLSAVALGLAAAAAALTNAWDAPLLGGLLLITMLVAALGRGAPPIVSAGRAAVALALSLATVTVAAGALWPPGGRLPAIGRNLEQGASGLDVATVFGLFFFLLAAWWLAAAADRWAPSKKRTAAVTTAALLLLGTVALRSADAFCIAGLLLFAVAFFAFAEKPEDRLAAALAGSAFFFVLFAQRLFIYDRMNTFFKLYLESWVLFAVASAVLVFRPRERGGSFARWPAVWKGVFALLAILSAFTAVTAARGALNDARPTRKAEGGRPTLDGLRYLEKTAPGEYRAVLWLRQTLRGTPVVLEAQGPSYQDFGRISMLTGLPTVLGWEYHVQQRGNSSDEIARRRSAVESIYSNPNVDAVEGLLRRYHVGYIVVGPLERRTYPRAGLAKFDAAPALFQLAYENPEERIYRVAGGDTQDVIEPRREELPATPGQVTEIVEPEEPPIISSTPSPGKPPFSGLREPRGAAFDEKGRLWVADFGHSRLRLYDADGGYLGGWGGRGDGTFAFRELCAVAARGKDLYVADTWNGRVEAFTIDGAWKATARELYGPRGIASATDGSVWVTDTGNHRLVVYDANLANPRFLGKKGSGPLEFESPVGIAAGTSGTIYACDTGNRRIQVLDANGRFLRVIPVPGWKGPVEPQIDVDEDEILYVSDPSGNAVLVLSAAGQLRSRLEADAEGRKFSIPTGVALDRKDRILYVVNSGDSSISKAKLPERKKE